MNWVRRALGSKRGGGRGHRDAEPVDPFLCAGCKLRTRCSTVLDEVLLDGDAVFVRRVGAAHRRHELVVQSRDERLPADPSKAPQARMSARRKNRTSSSSVTSAGRAGDGMRRGTERPLCGAWVRSIRRGRSGRRAGVACMPRFYRGSFPLCGAWVRSIRRGRRGRRAGRDVHASLLHDSSSLEE